ncbi:Yippee family putative zinc-binding protein [Striga asiatica]|uniref:Yippee family putative zinc-binding protein n=1 Tax=Striga asiatica TaxID=4170 RepID=A0A5A7R5E7_STRAF|nr:Yippee family putative zinc-binding protein [Striga asiatica]
MGLPIPIAAFSMIADIWLPMTLGLLRGCLLECKYILRTPSSCVTSKLRRKSKKKKGSRITLQSPNSWEEFWVTMMLLQVSLLPLCIYATLEILIVMLDSLQTLVRLVSYYLTSYVGWKVRYAEYSLTRRTLKVAKGLQLQTKITIY